MIKLLEHWELLLGLITSFFAFLGGKRMKRIKERKAGSDAVSSMQIVYDGFVKDIEARYQVMKSEIDELKNEVILLRKENAQLREEVHQWQIKYYRIARNNEEV